MKKAIALTGGIGCGKTFAASFFTKAGFAVLDTDDLAREVVKPCEPAWQKLKDSFGADFFCADGNLDRSKMARLVFAEPEARAQLNAIIHPAVHELWIRRVQPPLEKGGRVLVVVPLLFEAGWEQDFSLVVCVACSPSTQFARLCSRGWNADEIAARIGAQICVSEKMKRSDQVIWNDGSDNVLAKQVGRVVDSLKKSFI